MNSKNLKPNNVAFLIETNKATREDVLGALRLGAFSTCIAHAIVAMDLYGEPLTVILPGMERQWFQFSGERKALMEALRLLVLSKNGALWKEGQFHVLNEI